MRRSVFCLHGFLGEAEDWSSVFSSGVFPSGLSAGGVHAVDWLKDPAMSGARNLVELAHSVNRWARSSAGESRVLVGYSMGGRIALHALLEEPSLWDAAVIISSHPGFGSEAERLARSAKDQAWANRFRTEKWESVIRAWNAQPVFSSEPAPFSRGEEPGMREKLAWALEIGSLARQRDLRPELSRVERPILWMAGQKDEKYLALARECAKLNPRFRFAEIAGGGHRAPWTATRAFQLNFGNWINSFVKKQEAAS